jgi:hypothetical protein
VGQLRTADLSDGFNVYILILVASPVSLRRAFNESHAAHWKRDQSRRYRTLDGARHRAVKYGTNQVVRWQLKKMGSAHSDPIFPTIRESRG